MPHDRSASMNTTISRRKAMRAGVAADAADVSVTAGVTAPGRADAQTGAELLEIDVVVAAPVNITRAGGGPPQRGDWFYIDGPIYAAADDTDAPYQRLTTVQFLLDDRSIMGLINEAGADPDIKVGAIQGGTGRYTGALGTFRQIPEQGTSPGIVTPEATPAADATPAPARTVFRPCSS